MTISLSDLLATTSKDAALSTVRDFFQSLGFKVTSWQEGGIGMTTAHFLADLVSTLSEKVQLIAGGGFLDFATDSWLTTLAEQLYNETREPAIRTVGTMVLTSSTGAPVYDIQARQLWVTTASGLRFNNTTGGTLASGSSETLSLTWEAEDPGSSFNIPIGSSLEFVTATPGVTVTNPDTGSGDWISTYGADEESDEALRARCRLKWAVISYEYPAAAYEYWAQSASSSVTRVLVDDQNPDGPGTIRVYLAGESGGISDSGIITAVDDVLQLRRAVSAQVTTVGATNVAVAITGTVYYRGVDESTATANVEAAVASLFSSIPIGGEVIDPDPGAVFTDSIIDAIRGAAGVIKFTLSTPAADVELDITEVATADVSGLTYTAA